MLIKRRDFLKAGSLASAALFMPRFLKAIEPPGSIAPQGRSVVIIQLNGGNDCLNTVAPLRNDLYYKARPRLALKATETHALGDEVGLHPSLTALKGLWDEGSMALLNSVGYPNPDRSHFRSMDIWHSASPASEYWNTGWIGRYLDANCAGRPHAALEFDDTLSLALKGENTKGLALENVKKLYQSTRHPFFAEYAAAHTDTPQAASPLDYLYKTMSETLSSAQYLYEKSGKQQTRGNYPATGLGKDLGTIASLILSDTDTSVYYASLGSFDTHINQQGQQKRLFDELNDALGAFAADMKANGKWNEVLVFTFSEFGRRVEQNASGGTDHGAAGHMMFFGGGLRQKGMLNPGPDLSALDNGDLKFQVDFRQVYATVLQNWLSVPAEPLLGTAFTPMLFV